MKDKKKQAVEAAIGVMLKLRNQELTPTNTYGKREACCIVNALCYQVRDAGITSGLCERRIIEIFGVEQLELIEYAYMGNSIGIFGSRLVEDPDFYRIRKISAWKYDTLQGYPNSLGNMSLHKKAMIAILENIIYHDGTFVLGSRNN